MVEDSLQGRALLARRGAHRARADWGWETVAHADGPKLGVKGTLKTKNTGRVIPHLGLVTDHL